MSTTDTRAAFEATILDLYPVATFGRFASGRYNIDWIENQWGGWQLALAHAATEAAKATGTAGELPPMVDAWYHGITEKHFEHAMYAYGQQCAEAARHDADAAKRLRLICKMVGIESHVPADDETLWGAAFAVLGQVRAALEAARQPAPVAIKTWQERKEMQPDYIEIPDNCHMEDEIADLRAALAAINRSQP